jgi:hypothetical protein
LHRINQYNETLWKTWNIAIDKLSDTLTNKNLISTGLINTTFRQATIENGFAYNGIKFSSYFKDSLLLDSLINILKKKNYLLFESNQINFYRSNVIKSSLVYDRDSCKICTKLYFEINVPIEGWENLDLFNIYNNDINDMESLFFEKYYTSTISIPVYVYTTKNNVTAKKNFIYIYELVKPKGWKFKKYIEL